MELGVREFSDLQQEENYYSSSKFLELILAQETPSLIA